MLFQRFAGVGRLVLGHPRSFICAGVAIQVLGIGPMSPMFVGIGPAEDNGHMAAVDYVWAVTMPLACVWYFFVFAVSISGYNWVMLLQFKPLGWFFWIPEVISVA